MLLSNVKDGGSKSSIMYESYSRKRINGTC